MSEETLNILNELSKKETTDLALNIMELTADNMVKDKENKRLNNIINELEKYLDEALGQDMYRYDFKIILDKLYELKGENK